MLLISSIRIGKFVNHYCRGGKKRELDYYFFLKLLLVISRRRGCSAGMQTCAYRASKLLSVLGGQTWSKKEG